MAFGRHASALGLLLLYQIYTLQGAHWGYEGEHGVTHWAHDYYNCGGQKQSPIHLHTGAAIFSRHLADFDIVNDADASTVSKLSNNGHAVIVETNAEVLVNGGNLGHTYKVAQAHFHWGSDWNKGSEHWVNGHSYPLEMHIVTYDFEKYESAVALEGGLGPVLAAKDPTGLAVLGIFFTLSAKDNPNLEPLLAHFDEVRSPTSGKVDVNDFYLWDLLPTDTSQYYRYQGSLTTPTCDEVVVWTLFEEKNFISESQLERFRSLQDELGHAMQDNWRPTQPMNDRQLFKSFKPPSYSQVDLDSSAHPASVSHLVLVSSALALGLLRRLF